MKTVTIKVGWVMVHSTGLVFYDSFSLTMLLCWAKAEEIWALHGETRKENPKWKPKKCTAQFIV